MASQVPSLVRRYQPLLRQLLSFAGVGVIATSGQFALLAALVETGLAGPVLASLCGMMLGAVISYTLNRRFTFNATRSHAGAVPRFAVVAVVAFLLDALLMELFAHRLGLFYLLAQVLTTGLILIWTYGASRFWAYGHVTPQETAPKTET